METVQTVKAKALSEGFISITISSNRSSFVLTAFWVNNFDVKVESQTGKNSINMTHLVA